MTTKTKFKAGMFLLETLTSGMYNEPLSVYREYIQNAVDSIDLVSEDDTKDLVIDITLDPFEKTIVIFDNGEGIASHQAEKTLSSIGSSTKIGTKQRGFRGIGRLGGIAFAEKAIFRTKAKGDKVQSIQEWDCSRLKTFLANPDHSSLTIEQVFEEVTSFRQEKSDLAAEESFFEVTLQGVRSFRNYIFDIAKIKDYLGQVAPLAFDPDNFSYGQEIKKYLSKNLNQYGEYNIRLNGIPVYRPYTDEIKVTNKRKNDFLDGIEFFQIELGGETAAFGWYGKRQELLGAISKGMGVSGIRVKAGNIMIGDQHLLDKSFREDRFNSYLIGEVHVNSLDLVPNSRRDDFVDNEKKNLFYNEFEKVVGLPLSKEIRLRSRMSASGSATQEAIREVSQKEPQNGNGRKPVLCTKRRESSSNTKNEPESIVMKVILAECRQCPKLDDILKSTHP
jgi:molecular chaperone HtpG